MTLGGEIDAALRLLGLLAEGAATPAKAPIASIKPTTTAPPDYDAAVVEWRHRVERLSLAMRVAIQDAQHGPRPRRVTTAELRKRIRTYEGRDDVFVAFVECCGIGVVHAARAAVGLDPGTGFRKQAPLTSREADIT